MILTQDSKAIEIIRVNKGSTTKEFPSLNVGEQKILTKTPLYHIGLVTEIITRDLSQKQGIRNNSSSSRFHKLLLTNVM